MRRETLPAVTVVWFSSLLDDGGVPMRLHFQWDIHHGGFARQYRAEVRAWGADTRVPTLVG
jgi:hypothetical protein